MFDSKSILIDEQIWQGDTLYIKKKGICVSITRELITYKSK